MNKTVYISMTVELPDNYNEEEVATAIERAIQEQNGMVIEFAPDNVMED